MLETSMRLVVLAQFSEHSHWELREHIVEQDRAQSPQYLSSSRREMILKIHWIANHAQTPIEKTSDRKKLLPVAA